VSESESTILKRVQVAASERGARLMRNNVAKSWVGESIFQADGSVVISNPRRLNAGLAVGSSDLIGWTPQIVTAEMIGRTVAVFTAVETKSRGGRLTTDQALFIKIVKDAGGIAGVCRSVADYEGLK